MALIYFDGFDSYTTADLLSRYNIATGAMVIQGGAGRFGSGAIQCNQSGGSEALTKFFAPRTDLIAGVAWLHVLTNHPVGEASQIIQFGDVNIGTSGADGSGAQVEVGINTNSVLCITKNNRQTTLATGTTILQQSTYYYIELKVHCAGGSGGSAEVRLNGVTEVSCSSVNTNPQGTGTMSRISLKYDNFKVLPSFDDFYVADTSGSSNNNFLGDVRVETQIPNGAGHYTAFSLHGAASNHAAVSESIEDQDGSYVYTQTLNAIDTYTLPALSSAADVIAGIQVTTIGRKDDAGVRTLKHVLRISSTDYLGPEIPVTDTYTYDSRVYETNPNTSVAWVAADLTGLEIGVKLIS